MLILKRHRFNVFTWNTRASEEWWKASEVLVQRCPAMDGTIRVRGNNSPGQPKLQSKFQRNFYSEFECLTTLVALFWCAWRNFSKARECCIIHPVFLRFVSDLNRIWNEVLLSKDVGFFLAGGLFKERSKLNFVEATALRNSLITYSNLYFRAWRQEMSSENLFQDILASSKV